MAFSTEQKRTLEAKLSAKHVKTREVGEVTLSYIEGWHVIAEANRIFGYDAWDRETLHTSCVWQGASRGRHACSYLARVRISVRAGPVTIVREGTGAGHSIGRIVGEAHENAIKEAETDAMKRALMTFGNPFGLALYDKKQRGVRHLPKMGSRKTAEKSDHWKILSGAGKILSSHSDPVEFCSVLRFHLEHITDPQELLGFWNNNRDIINRLRQLRPELKTNDGRHYADILDEIYATCLNDRKYLPSETGSSKRKESSEDKGSTPLALLDKPTRRRDEDHRKFIRSRPCLICRRFPSQAHHIRFAQPRGLGLKVSDEWTVPLCLTHHRALHSTGNEETWWQDKKIDPMVEAQKFWERSTKSRTENGTPK
ncbi:MAG: Rad52/Rad22 family DNA repair protein [Alphaproteobacteria bacterium]